MRTLLLLGTLTACASPTDTSPTRLLVDWGAHDPVEGEPGLVWEDVDGWAVVQGDIIIGRAADMRTRGTTVLPPSWTWPTTTIAYEIANGTPDRREITDALDMWEASTSIRFVTRTNEVDYLRFTDGSRCASSIGRVGGEQVILAAAPCSVGNIAHEIGHALGLFHEHVREDRDDHVDVLWDCLTSGSESNFESGAFATKVWGPYDDQSLMHYGSWAFLDSTATTGGQPCDRTLRRLDGSWIDEQRTAPSLGDARAIDALFQAGPVQLGLEIVQPPVSGGRLRLRAFGGEPGTPMGFLATPDGAGAGPCFGIMQGTCLDLLGRIRPLAQGVFDAAGTASYGRNLSGGPDLTDITFQAVAPQAGPGLISPPVSWVDPVDRPCVDPTQTRDCRGHCFPAWPVGNGTCDDGGTLHAYGDPDYDCDVHGWDDGDCP